MSRNAPAIALAVVAALLLVVTVLLFRAYREADTERVVLRDRVGALEREISAANQKIMQLESQVSTLTQETARLHEQNQRLHQLGADRQRGS